jgi:hypothetical protein
MPRLRRGPEGPTTNAGGAPGTNKTTPHSGAGVSGMDHEKTISNVETKGSYGGKSYGGKKN